MKTCWIVINTPPRCISFIRLSITRQQKALPGIKRDNSKHHESGDLENKDPYGVKFNSEYLVRKVVRLVCVPVQVGAWYVCVCGKDTKGRRSLKAYNARKVIPFHAPLSPVTVTFWT